MVCPICKQDLKIIEKEADYLEDNLPKVNKYALCRFCNKQWRLTKATNAPKSEEKRIKIVGEDESAPSLDVSKLAEVLSLAQRKHTETKKEEIPPIDPDAQFLDSFQEVEFDLEPSSDKPLSESGNKSREDAKYDIEEIENEAKSSPRVRNKNRAKSSPRGKKSINYEDTLFEDIYDEDIDDEDITARSTTPGKNISSAFKKGFAALEEKGGLSKINISLVRKVLGILSILAFVFFFFNGVTTSELAMAISFIALSIFCLGAGVFQLFTQKNKDITSFVFPALLYIIGGVIAFLQSENSLTLLFGAIIALIVAIALVVLAVFAKNEKT